MHLLGFHREAHPEQGRGRCAINWHRARAEGDTLGSNLGFCFPLLPFAFLTALYHEYHHQGVGGGKSHHTIINNTLGFIFSAIRHNPLPPLNGRTGGNRLMTKGRGVPE